MLDRLRFLALGNCISRELTTPSLKEHAMADDMRDRIAEALAPSGWLREDGLPATIDAVMAVVGPEVERLRKDRDVARNLLEAALHLRMYGERAPGGNENWADWDRDAERFLRGEQP
jgi:hypothetical protein